MDNLRHHITSPRILYLGTQNSFSLAPLLALLRDRQSIEALVIPNNPVQSLMGKDMIELIPTPTNDTIIDSARKHGIPVWDLSHLPFTLEFDLLIVACFPQRVPQSLLKRATIAALNIHPSKLPAYRGPAPLFWQLKDGMREIGVTLHHITEDIDAGDIISQTDITLPVGISGSSADEMLSRAGAKMLLATIHSGDFSGQLQTGSESYQSWPRKQDWIIPTSWSVMHAFNFMRGMEEWGHSFTLLARPKSLTARTATDFTLGTSTPGAVRHSQSGDREVGFADGWLQVC